MMRSMFSGVSGLRVHQTKMDVIANNIANVNTIGFKSSRVTFNEVFYQRIQGASGESQERGRAGTNPMQIGLGASVASIDNIMTQGAAQRTDNAMDVMVQGEGFLIVSDAGGNYFTRAGNIGKDAAGNLHVNGRKLMGWDTRKNADTGDWEVAQGTLVPLTITGEKEYAPPATTTIVDMIGNLNPLELDDTGKIERTMEFYTSDGTRMQVDVVFDYVEITDGSGNVDYNRSGWIYYFKPDPNYTPAAGVVGAVPAYANGVRPDPATGKPEPYYLAINMGDFSVAGTAPTLPDTTRTDGSAYGFVQFDTNGALSGYGTANLVPGNPTATPPVPDSFTIGYNRKTAGSNNQFSINITPIDPLDPRAYIGSNPVASSATAGAPMVGTINLDFTEFTQFDGEDITAKILYADGNGPGTLRNLSIDPNGVITGSYSNGDMRILGQVPLAFFDNPAGLEKIGNSLFAATANSGQFDGVGQAGELMGGVLEMSNVDLSQEFTEMITTQRGFQANSRTISTSDEMLQELVNLKR